MDALFKVRPDELGQDLLDKIRLLIRDMENTEIIIQVKEKTDVNLVDEDPAAYMQQLRNSFRDKEEGRTTTFTMDEFRQYVRENFAS